MLRATRPISDKLRMVFVTCLSLIVISIQLAGCQSQGSNTPFEAVMNASCIAEIVPGSSAERDVRTALENCETIDRGSLVRDEGMLNSRHLVTYRWTLSSFERGQIRLTDDAVSMISLQVKPGPKLSEYLSNFGEPASSSAFYRVYEQCIASITLDYPAKGISLGIGKAFDCASISQDGSASVLVDEDTNVTEYYRYVPGELNAVLQNAFLMTEEVMQANFANRHEWGGYGELRIKP